MMREVIPDYGIDTIRQLFRKVTFDSESKILYFTEFVAVALGYKKGIVTMDRLWRAFDRLDHEKRGFISRENMSEILGSDYNEDRIDDIFEKQDSGEISFATFVGFYDSFLQ
jgi:Ca2+-binding EF-hand superfamily protein